MDALKSTIRNNWNHHAENYDTQYQHGLHSEAEKQAWLELLRELIPERGQKILDVGAGTGFLSLLLAEQGHIVKGIDLSSGMLAKARKKAAEQHLDITFCEGDAENLDEADESYDVVVNRHLLWAMPHPKQAIREWRRVLRKGGKLIIIDGDWHYNLFRNNIRIFFGKLLCLLADRENHFKKSGSGLQSQLPMTQPKNAKAAPDMVRAAGLSVEVRGAAQVEAAERSVMPLRHRLMNPYRRIVIIGTRKD